MGIEDRERKVGWKEREREVDRERCLNYTLIIFCSSSRAVATILEVDRYMDFERN